jgi:hypothetical protein
MSVAAAKVCSTRSRSRLVIAQVQAGEGWMRGSGQVGKVRQIAKSRQIADRAVQADGADGWIK